MQTILITGSSGFVGGCAVARFQSAGWKTFGVGRRPLDQTGYHRCDLSQPLDPDLIKVIRQSEVVLHAAARSSPWGTRRQFHAANVRATANLLDACEANGRPRFIFISSSSVYYREQDQLDILESTPLAKKPINHYAASKQVAERLIQNYHGSWSILRPRAVYGKGDTVLFPRILAAAQAGRLPLLTRPGPPAMGDLISIHNLTDCLLRAASDPAIHGSYNLTDNAPQEIISFLLEIFSRLNIKPPEREISVRNAHRLARLLEMVYGSLIPWKEPPITRFGVHVFAFSKTFDVSKMIEGFGPPCTTTETAIDEFVSWVKNENPYQLN